MCAGWLRKSLAIEMANLVPDTQRHIPNVPVAQIFIF